MQNPWKYVTRLIKGKTDEAVSYVNKGADLNVKGLFFDKCNPL